VLLDGREEEGWTEADSSGYLVDVRFEGEGGVKDWVEVTDVKGRVDRGAIGTDREMMGGSREGFFRPVMTMVNLSP